MAVTIGAFSSNKLRAQPFGYEGDARNGLTATTLEFSGLVKPSEWLAFKGIYDAWRNLRIQDQDTLVSKTVGTTVSVTASANGVSWTNKPCWFTEAPSASQFGTMVEVSATLVDAAEALQVFLKEESGTDCARIKADLEKQKAETDCEITALQSGLADDFADQEVALELIRGNADFDARVLFADDLAELNYKNEVQEKTAQKNKLPTYAGSIAGLDVDLDLINRSAQFNAQEPKKGDLAEADYKDEVQSKQGQLSKVASYATTIAGLDADLEILQVTGDLAGRTGKVDTIAGLNYQVEIQNKTAQKNTVATYAETIAALDADINILERTGELAANNAASRAQSIAGLDYQFEVQDKTAQDAVFNTYANTIAGLDADLELKGRNAEFNAQETRAGANAELDYKFEVQKKTAEKNQLPTYVASIAGLDVDLELINRNAQFNAREPKKGDLAELDYKQEVQSKQGQVSKVASYATTIAGLDEDLDLAQSDADLAAFTPAKRAQIAGNEYDREVLQNTAEITALSTRLSTLKASRQLKALYDKELSEDLPNFGTQSLGSATIQLIEPPEGRIETPSFALTATGNALITGALKPVKTREINGVVTSGGSAAVLAWYDATVATRPAAGALFPASAPTFEIESVLVNGVKGSRTNVQVSVIEIPS
jgi:hypothetical protein